VKPPRAPHRKSSGLVPVAEASGLNLDQLTERWVPWNESARLYREGETGNHWNPRLEAENVEVPPEMVARMQARQPVMRRRTAAERAQVLATELFEQALNVQRRLGYVVWPTSIEKQLVALGAEKKDVYDQVSALVTHYMLKSENNQKEQDQHRSTVAWHGHYD
jgi:hypothetical protein